METDIRSSYQNPVGFSLSGEIRLSPDGTFHAGSDWRSDIQLTVCAGAS